MSERFLQLNIENEIHCEADFLASKHPFAFLLLYWIARRARRISGLTDGLDIGTAKIGDWEEMGMSRQNYRTALKVLIKYKFLEILETNRTRKKSTTGSTTEGTLVRLLDSRIWDINPEPTNQRSNHCPTTAQPLPNHERRKNKKDISNDISNEEEAQSASRLRSRKDLLSFNFETWAFEGISPDDRKSWSLIYPHIVLDVEITKSIEWLKANPSKNNKKNWRKFLTGWFQRSNETQENKKAFKASGSYGSPVDRRTKNIDGTPVENPLKGVF